LDPDQPLVTYLCSSDFVARGEREFVMRWIDEIRQAPELASCNVLIRPHPRHVTPWQGFTPDRPRAVVQFARSISVDQTLYDAVYHSVAVVGLNTSAQLEAGIVGRPVLTILAPEFSGGQEGTLHFRYLLREHGGFVELAPDFETHRRQLAAAVGGAYDRGDIQAFIGRFLRPHGLEHAVVPIMADAIEGVAASRQRPAPIAWLRRRAEALLG
jgi:hypothetical protein